VVRPWESIIIGMIGGTIAVLCSRLLDRVGVDDPVGAVSVHGAGGIWVSERVMVGVEEWRGGGVEGWGGWRDGGVEGWRGGGEEGRRGGGVVFGGPPGGG
jgi:Amt family ammonium transporter